MRILSLTAIAVVAFGLMISVANRISAQEPPPSQFEHIQGLEPFVGFWRGNVPGEGDEGEVPMTVSCRLTSNRSYLRMQVSTRREGERETVGTMLIGRDFAKDQVSLWGFWAERQTHGKVEVGEGKATWTETGVGSDGIKMTGNVAMKVDGDTLTVDLTDLTHGDDTQPDMHLAFTRIERPFGRRGGQ